MTLHSLQTEVSQQFTAHFDRAPEHIAAAPGRVNLIGEHIDYNDGWVLPMAIDRYTVVAVAPNDSYIINVAAPDMDDSTTFDLSVSLQPEPGHWTGYVLGVIAGIQMRVAPVNGFDALIRSNVPLGGGLSSSAALTVAFATAIEGLTGLNLKPLDKALLCKAAENRFAGVPCGIMDPLTSVVGQEGHALLIDCVTHDVEPIPFDSSNVAILVTNSGVKHDLAEDAYAQRQDECRSALKKLGLDSWRDVTPINLAEKNDTQSEAETKRVCHIISETSRTKEAVDEIARGDWKAFGELLLESHRSLRDDFEVSCKELDTLVDILESTNGVYGARMTGGGFGGCTVALIEANAADRVIEHVRDEYAQQTGIHAESFIVRPSDGPALL